ncbi:MAG: Glutamyl-tRNA(Gln) amidotransferase subunit A [Microgenomates group bacterium GW2011_GWC1_41_20]|uniref:Glutamyl-tRNA(Gln) amidotransferase subunit A n=4 Tax=Candidatus Woeseibacteriota TaxID=1752722 RepID=A0A0G0RT43_9BACT|nr:MAG: Glutamyl-tRNA(Gln) amidotransferase subunit A [Candidatus Woesebacteria bacterium GW2011_GWB1_40_12]KKR55869.1 MAG: Glutamyl-tRNA(Gln) amidotransferase subunit A [Candidatus Woesebacteria bacterium GW2011_GWF1_40_24]KKR90782.1 MAG: Glutamyl-tRNA(Gln) amidotransferase subunit A [Candidatus Woesebacteria bacterium GW2011_GWD1_41_12]KKR99236.1 MAG: Glutamyl-tRNA(Gln) amidotransferase subunit A [Microgenomates group bacterium GW2011_GWC1_41_20]OGM84693.1 MAG: glutaminyl-tRNA synthase (gluta
MTNTPLTIKETQKGILEKDFSSVELVDTYLERIEKNKDLNAYITVCDEAAYKKAKEVDQLVKSGEENLIEKFPLLGVTVGHKDLFLTKGIRTTAGSKVLESYIPPYSATVVERMEKAGAVVLGKTNCDAWAHGASGENSDFGPAINPWDKDMVPGGSSSGSAASVAAGLSLVATGTDTGGSIRQPANFCGIVGLKPTYGAVPRYGVIAMASSLDSMGSFGKSVNEVETIFNVTRGEDGFDSTVKNTELFKPKSRMKIGIPKEYFVEGVDSEIADKVMEVSKVFEKTGIELVQISLPHTKYAISVYYIVQPAEVSSNLGRYDGIRYGNPRVSFGAEAKRRIMLGTYVLSAGYYDAYYLKAQKVRSRLIEDFEKAFNGVDAILAPVSPTPAFKIGEKAEDPLKMYLADIFTAPANLAGIPGLAMPSGFNKNKLPLGFQLLGPRFSEPVLFGLGKLYEDETNYKPGLPKL